MFPNHTQPSGAQKFPEGRHVPLRIIGGNHENEISNRDWDGRNRSRCRFYTDHRTRSFAISNGGCASKIRNGCRFFVWRNRETGPKLSGVQNQKNRVERTWLQMGPQGKVWRKPTEANGSQTSTPAAQADWYGDATEIQLSTDDSDFESKKESLKSAGFRWDGKEKCWRKSDQ